VVQLNYLLVSDHICARAVLNSSRRYCTIWPKLLPFVALVWTFSASQGFASAAEPESAPVTQQSNSVWSFTDLDGDLQPDLVRSTPDGSDRTGYRFQVEFEMSAGRRSAPIPIHTSDAWGMQMAPRDVDGDHDLDLVVTGGAYRSPVGVWINDGRGGFTPSDQRLYPAWIWLEGWSLSGFHPRTSHDTALMASHSDGPGITLRTFLAISDSGVRLNGNFENRRADVAFTGGASPRAPPVA
jgi:hypothetical protein